MVSATWLLGCKIMTAFTIMHGGVQVNLVNLLIVSLGTCALTSLGMFMRVEQVIEELATAAQLVDHVQSTKKKS